MAYVKDLESIILTIVLSPKKVMFPSTHIPIFHYQMTLH